MNRENKENDVSGAGVQVQVSTQAQSAILLEQARTMKDTPSSPQAEVFLRVEGLGKGYGEGDARVEVLRNIDVSLSTGEMSVLLGPSGSGKSTFLNIIGGLESADEGRIVIDRYELTKLSSKKIGEYRRNELGFVFQFYNLVPDLTIKENIEVCAHLGKNPLSTKDLLGSLGLWDHRNKFPRQVSGGQQQRCAIGRALVKNPRLLLCDEPTGALDYKTSKEILVLIEQVNKEYGCTVVIVTHNDAIKNMATRVLRLHDGCLIENSINSEPIPAEQLEW